MKLSQYYRQQYAWRPWDRIYPLLGDLSGQTVLDLGCGIGDQAADLAGLGAKVIGVDMNESLVEVARAREIPRARFVCAELPSFALASGPVDGIWSSFTVAYFPRIEEALDSWGRWLVPGGWMAVTEVDDLFGHEPLERRYCKLIEEYYARSLEEWLYAFRSRDRLHDALVSRSWEIAIQEEFPDHELSFDGPADDAVFSAWRTRLDLMLPRFVERFGEDAVGFREAFLDCLVSAEHRSRARVWFLMVRRPLANRDGESPPSSPAAPWKSPERSRTVSSEDTGETTEPPGSEPLYGQLTGGAPQSRAVSDGRISDPHSGNGAGGGGPARNR